MYFFLAILTLISFIVFKIYQSLRVPEELKDVPALSFMGPVFSLITGTGPDKRWEGMRQVLEKEGIGRIWMGGEWSLFVTDLGLVKDMLTKTDLYPKIMLERIPRSITTHYLGTNLVFSNGDVWKRHRGVANPAFRNVPIHVFSESAMKLLKFMERVDSEPIDVENLMRRVTLDVLGKAEFGFDFNSLEDPNNVYATTYYDVYRDTFNLLYFYFPFLNYLPRTEARKKIAKLHKLFDGIVETKLKSMKDGELDKKIDNNTADLLDCMIHASNDPENPTLTNEELRYNMAMFMFAGHDTTATALTSTLYLLATHKDVQEKVRDEILDVLGDDLTPNREQQKKLKYMNMVMNENLRLYPPILFIPRRYASQDVKFRNYIIPAGTALSIYAYGIHHSSKNWEEPEKFIPERFMNEETEKQKHDHHAWLSFGGGSRFCIGNNFSLVEQKVMLCSLLRKYEVSLPPDSVHKDKLQIKPGSAIILHPMPLIFKRKTQ